MLLSVAAFAQGKTYKASMFGVKSNGQIDNTASIQRAVNFIAEQGGGTLEFNVGRYLTGAVELKSGVNIKMNEGSVIVGSTNIFDYRGKPAIFWADNQENISIIGVGVFDGRGPELLADIAAKQAKGILSKDVVVPSLLSIVNCKNVTLKKIILRNPATAPDLYILKGTDAKVEGCYCDTAR